MFLIFQLMNLLIIIKVLEIVICLCVFFLQVFSLFAMIYGCVYMAYFCFMGGCVGCWKWYYMLEMVMGLDLSLLAVSGAGAAVAGTVCVCAGAVRQCVRGWLDGGEKNRPCQ